MFSPLIFMGLAISKTNTMCWYSKIFVNTQELKCNYKPGFFYSQFTVCVIIACMWVAMYCIIDMLLVLVSFISLEETIVNWCLAGWAL